MRKPERITLEQVPEIPPDVVGIPSGSSGDVVYENDRDRWRKNKDGELLYYIRYAPNRDKQEVIYERRRR